MASVFTFVFSLWRVVFEIQYCSSFATAALDSSMAVFWELIILQLHANGSGY
jgi:hypothetical protein